MTDPASPAWRGAERAARASYGRLLAILAAQSGDVELAEDALADAFERALRTWPESGVPANPDAWLLAVARNRQRDLLRSAAHRISESLEGGGAPFAAEPDGVEPGGADPDDLDPTAIPDRRLALLFVCAHPAIAPVARTPLMLQAVLGFEAGEIAGAFAVPVSTMAQRLVRANRRIRDARIPFAVPDRGQMPARLPTVLEAIYGAYSIGWWRVSGPTTRDALAHEAHFLATTLASLLGDEPEALGLAALLSFSLARAAARNPGGRFVPLEEQDPTEWDEGLVREGEAWLHRAHALGRTGRFQVEAAIQSVHCARARSGVTDRVALLRLHEDLVRLAPTLGARVALAAALARVEGVAAGLQALEGIDDPGVEHFQPAWATRAHLLAGAGRREEAGKAYAKAISLTTEPDLRTYLEGRWQSVVTPPAPAPPPPAAGSWPPSHRSSRSPGPGPGPRRWGR